MIQLDMLPNLIPSPPKPDHLPHNIYWLSGEACGSWFHIEQYNFKYVISRYSPEGKLECKGLFEQFYGPNINLSEIFEFTYLSHCSEVNIIQDSKKLQFKLSEKC